MFLLVAATPKEMSALSTLPAFKQLKQRSSEQIETLITGVGMVSTALSIERYLTKNQRDNIKVLQFGIGGAYLSKREKTGEQIKLLDICLAEKEVFGDFGVCVETSILYLDKDLYGDITIPLENPFSNKIADCFVKNNRRFFCGTFISVQSVSGTQKRGDFLAEKWSGLCENMEGAAAAKVCADYGVDFAELRSISNFVEDRNIAQWEIDKGCEVVGQVVVDILRSFCFQIR